MPSKIEKNKTIVVVVVVVAVINSDTKSLVSERRTQKKMTSVLKDVDAGHPNYVLFGTNILLVPSERPSPSTRVMELSVRGAMFRIDSPSAPAPQSQNCVFSVTEIVDAFTDHIAVAVIHDQSYHRSTDRSYCAPMYFYYLSNLRSTPAQEEDRVFEAHVRKIGGECILNTLSHVVVHLFFCRTVEELEYTLDDPYTRLIRILNVEFGLQYNGGSNITLLPANIQSLPVELTLDRHTLVQLTYRIEPPLCLRSSVLVPCHRPRPIVRNTTTLTPMGNVSIEHQHQHQLATKSDIAHAGNDGYDEENVTIATTTMAAAVGDIPINVQQNGDDEETTARRTEEENKEEEEEKVEKEKKVQDEPIAKLSNPSGNARDEFNDEHEQHQQQQQRPPRSFVSDDDDESERRRRRDDDDFEGDFDSSTGSRGGGGNGVVDPSCPRFSHAHYIIVHAVVSYASDATGADFVQRGGFAGDVASFVYEHDDDDFFRQSPTTAAVVPTLQQPPTAITPTITATARGEEPVAAESDSQSVQSRDRSSTAGRSTTPSSPTVVVNLPDYIGYRNTN